MRENAAGRFQVLAWDPARSAKRADDLAEAARRLEEVGGLRRDRRWLAALAEKLPALDMEWPDEMREQWFKWVADLIEANQALSPIASVGAVRAVLGVTSLQNPQTSPDPAERERIARIVADWFLNQEYGDSTAEQMGAVSASSETARSYIDLSEVDCGALADVILVGPK